MVQERKGELSKVQASRAQGTKQSAAKRKKKTEEKGEQVEARRLDSTASGEGGITHKTVRKVHRKCEERGQQRR
jgi:hypothetical protein